MKKNNILIIGSSGYIGSRLVADLSSEYSVSTCDIKNDSSGGVPDFKKDYGHLLETDIRKFQCIIILAGNSSVKSCEIPFSDVLENNVINFQYLLDMITRAKLNIKVIYASSASVYGTSGGTIYADENTPLSAPVNNYDASKQIIDLIARQYMSDVELYGLRFGTVNGYSPNMRWDLIINAMCKSANLTNAIHVSNSQSSRSILALCDMVSAIKSIIENTDSSKRGIYNLASDSGTVLEFANKCTTILNAKIYGPPPDPASTAVYDFRMSTSKFIDAFPNWKPLGTVRQIIGELKSYFYPVRKDGTYNLKFHSEMIDPQDYYLTTRSDKDFVPLNECLCCGSKSLLNVIDLGRQPLANSFHNNLRPLERYPLQLNVCTECFHCQLSIAVDPKLMFTDYKYVSGTTDTLKQYFEWFANYVMEENPYLTSVLDIGSNDGTQLDEFRKNDIRTTVGIDPAENLCAIASRKGHLIENQYFNKDFKFKSLQAYDGGVAVIADNNAKFDCIIAQNVFAHNSNPLEFLQKCEQYLRDTTGVLYIQVSQADMIMNGEFDTIYHEHISFFNINSMTALIDRTASLSLVDVIKTPIHGNSYIFVIKKKVPSKTYKIGNLINLERNSGLYDIGTYKTYAFNIESLRLELETTLESLIDSNTKIIGYGAAAKGMTLLNYMELPIDFIIDDNPLKQGLYCPGTNIPIMAISELAQYPSSKLVIIPLAWNFFTEIKSRIQKMNLPNNIRWVKYFPKVQLTANV